MKVAAKGCTLIGTEGSCPPLPYIEVSDSSGKALIGMGQAVKYTGPEAEEAPAPAPAPPAKKGKKAAEAPPPPPAKEDEDREETILHALDLVEGEPTVEAVAEITGLADVSAEEIAAAVAAKEAAADA